MLRHQIRWISFSINFVGEVAFCVFLKNSLQHWHQHVPSDIDLVAEILSQCLNSKRFACCPNCSIQFRLCTGFRDHPLSFGPRFNALCSHFDNSPTRTFFLLSDHAAQFASPNTSNTTCLGCHSKCQIVRGVAFKYFAIRTRCISSLAHTFQCLASLRFWILTPTFAQRSVLHAWGPPPARSRACSRFLPRTGLRGPHILSVSLFGTSS